MVRAMVLEAPERLVLHDNPLREIGADDGLLQVELAGICHTDIAHYHGLATRPLPLVLGREIVGQIARAGPLAARCCGVRESDR